MAEDAPAPLRKSPALRALYNNVKTVSGSDETALDLAIKVDETVRRVKPDDFRGHQARENTIKAALLPLLKNDVDEVERIFLIIKAQREYLTCRGFSSVTSQWTCF